MSIGRQIVWGFSAVGLTISAASIYIAGQMEAELRMMNGQTELSHQNFEKIEARFEEATREGLTYLLSGNVEHRKSFDTWARGFGDSIKSYQRLLNPEVAEHDKKFLDQLMIDQAKLAEAATSLFSRHEKYGNIEPIHFRVLEKPIADVEETAEHLLHVGLQRATLQRQHTLSLVQQLRWALYGLAAIAMIAAVRIGYLLSKSMTGRIAEISGTARRLGAGQLESRINITSKDEIGELASVFNQMADHLQQSYETIEQKVAERTAELQIKTRLLENEIQERQQAQEVAQQRQLELAHLERLNTMSEMSAVLAHELNQPLCAMVTTAQACRRLLQSLETPPEHLTQGLDQIASQGSRAGKIIHHMRSFVSGQGANERTEENIEVIMKDAIDFCRSLARHHCVELLLTPPSRPVRADVNRIQIEQVLINLIRNGIEAMETMPPAERSLIVSAHGEQPALITIAVKDSGTGVPPDDFDRLFESFFTTKSKGMGIGLSLSRSIVEAHGGRLWPERNQDRGMTFYVTLPIRKPEHAHVQ